MSWESTAIYYKRLNERVRDALGGLHSADIVLHSVDFSEIVRLQTAGQWERASKILSRIAVNLEQAGAEIVLICTNTMHILAEPVQDAIDIPLLHIADVTGAAVNAAGSKRPLLLATRYTMEQSFYRDRLMQACRLAPLVPDADDRDAVHSIIFDELCQGAVRASSRERYLEIVARGRAKGADSVILGCTEIGMLIGASDISIPVFDSTILHADAAADFAIGRANVSRPKIREERAHI